MSNCIVSKAPALAYLFTVGLSLSGYAVDQQCITRHETCPEHYKQTTFTPSYQEIIKDNPIVQASPSVAPIAIVAIPTLNDDDHDGIENTLDQCPKTPKGYKVDSKGCPKSVTLHINFPFASNTLPDSSAKEVEILTTFIQENPACMITIIGHTDNNGIDARNQPRSEARAKALADKLISNGIDMNRIKTSGQGSKNPIASNATDAGRAQNRRIEVQIK
ncbi:MAG: OmpA family protein [Campylobacterales bacterium]|nr:OmpA family protein [Campylobacterales bacterium]